MFFFFPGNSKISSAENPIGLIGVTLYIRIITFDKVKKCCLLLFVDKKIPFFEDMGEFSKLKGLSSGLK